MGFWGFGLVGLGVAAHADGRDPLPALRVERAIAAPRGWWLWRTAFTSTRPTTSGPWSGDPLGRSAVVADLRFGWTPRVELSVAGGLAWRRVSEGPDAVGLVDPAFGARFTLLRREPPNTSVVAELGWRAGYGAAPGGVPVDVGVDVGTLALAAARQLGPVRVLARVGGELRVPTRVGWLPHDGRLDASDAVTGDLEALVQLGPVAPWVGVDGAWNGATRLAGVAVAPPELQVDAEVGVGAQLARWLAVDVVHGRPLAGGAPLDPAEVRGPAWTVAVEVAL